jgi:leucyl aminopeptidase (aminopeptidase T)
MGRSKKTETSKNIERVLTTCFKINPMTKVLVITDKKMQSLGKEFYKAAKQLSLYSYLVSMTPRKRDGEEPPKKIAKLMKNVDVVLAITFKSLTHTKAAIDAWKSGVNIASMPGLSKFSITKGGLTADYRKVEKLCKKLRKKLENSKRIEVFADNGTKVSFSIWRREWHDDEGLFTGNKARLGNLPAGEVFVAPVENSVNGEIIFDYFEKETGIYLKVKKGKVVETNSKFLNSIFRKLGRKARQVAEFGIGCNPKAKVIGNILEDEKAWKTCHFALGRNTGFGGKNDIVFHKDGIILNPTIIVDGKTLMKNGKLKI